MQYAQMARIGSGAAMLLSLAVLPASAQDGRGRGRGNNNPPPQVTAAEQQHRIQDEQRRSTQYQQHLDAQVRATQQQAAALQAQKRSAQYRAQQEYAARLAQQQQQLRAQRDYANDPYVRAPHTYRYRLNGAYHETNQYGVDVLRQAVNYGYQEGYSAGQADRQDHWRSDYANSPAYRDATYGYNGQYIDQSDYSYYFRQGFQRGYQDGYNSRFQYGTSSNGTYSILANVLSGILQLTTLH